MSNRKCSDRIDASGHVGVVWFGTNLAKGNWLSRPPSMGLPKAAMILCNMSTWSVAGKIGSL
jgi:hypothetical protein